VTVLLPSDLGGWFGGRTVIDVNRATTAIRMAEGWLQSATRIDPWPPNPVPEDVRAWLLELAALAYVNNPRQMTQRQTGGVITMWAPDAQSRRAEILDAARSRYNRAGMPSTVPQPVSPLTMWPDPALPWGYGVGYYR